MVIDVMFGIDPHKGSHTATMLDRGEYELGRTTVRAGQRQLAELLDGRRHTARTWAVESAGGMGYLLSQQLVPASETVLNVPATLASRGTRAEHRPVNEDGSERCPIGRRHRLAGWGVGAAG